VTVISAHAERVTSRVINIDIRKLILSILIIPFLLVGLTARYVVRAIVWTFGFMWFAAVEGWEMAAPKVQQT
jgi:hypothetical protein